MRPRFIALASVVGLALAAIVHADRSSKAPHAAAPSRHVQTAGLAQQAPLPPLPARHSPIVISERDRDAVYRYYGIDHADDACPAGLVKKSYGCLPPSGGTNRWTVGQRLSDDDFVYPLPGVLLGELSPPPSGYEYGRLGNDVLVIGIESRLVAGALASPDN